MKVLLMGIVVSVAIAAGLAYFLPQDPKLAWQAFSSTSARVDDPGSNLVGPRWTGENRIRAPAGGKQS